MHEGYVRQRWLDYDETWRNDAFLQDIFTVVLSDAPESLTQGDMLGQENPYYRECHVYFSVVSIL